MLLPLGFDGHTQDRLESVYISVMKLSIEHRHFKKNRQKYAQVEQRDQDQVPAEGVAETCGVCRDTFGIFGWTEDAASRFVCLSNEC